MQLKTRLEADGGRCRARRLPVLRAGLARLRKDRSGNALIEFAYSLPIFLVLGMYGAELAYMATVNMQVSQMAMGVADNASRLGQTDNSAVAPTITNQDVDSIMDGAIRQGAGISFQERGRIILSSLERDEATGRQYIHWQKCRGSLSQVSAYGPENLGLTGPTIDGLGRPGSVVSADEGSAVMFAEVYYDYKGLFGRMFVGDTLFRQEAAFVIRDDRKLGPGVTGAAGASECT